MGEMTKSVRLKHPIRIVRDALGEAEGCKITQEQFARRLGTGVETIEKVEQFDRDPTDRLCLQIHLLTGVYPYSIQTKNRKPLAKEPVMAYSRTPVTAEKIKSWKGGRTSEEHQIRDLYLLKRAELSLVSLGMAARAQKNCLDVVMVSLEKWLKTTAEEMGLTQAYWREFEKRAAVWNKRQKGCGEVLTVYQSANHHLVSSGLNMAHETMLKVEVGAIPAAKRKVGILEKSFERSARD
jgi:transcriptional regulator with XRE-family HTH domain